MAVPLKASSLDKWSLSVKGSGPAFILRMSPNGVGTLRGVSEAPNQIIWRLTLDY